MDKELEIGEANVLAEFNPALNEQVVTAIKEMQLPLDEFRILLWESRSMLLGTNVTQTYHKKDLIIKILAAHINTLQQSY